MTREADGGRSRLEVTREVIAGGLRTMAASFPGFASAAQGWNEIRAAQFEARVGALFDEIRAELARIAEQQGCSPENRMSDDEFGALVERVIEKVAREASEQKRSAYARALVRGAAGGEASAYDSVVGIVETLDTLTDRDLRALALFRPGSAVRVRDLTSPFAAAIGEPDNERAFGLLVRSLTMLDSRGLIGETAWEGPGSVHAYSGSADFWANRWRERVFEILPFGRDFVAHVHD